MTTAFDTRAAQDAARAATPDAPPQPGAIGWTPERKTLFLQALSVHGNARAACRKVGLSAESAYKLRRRDPIFARGWAAAVVLGRDNSIATLGERAIEGVEEQIYYRGELVGTRRRYDSRLLLAHLARLDALATDKRAQEDAGLFDDILAAVAADSGEMPLTRDAFVVACGEDAIMEQRMLYQERYPALFDESLGNLTADECDLAEELDELQDIAGDEARMEADEKWDEMHADAIAAVDALFERAGEAERAAPRALPPALSALVLNRPERAAGIAFPCTPSTASTTALAKALAGPAAFLPPQPRSPFRRR